MNRKEITDILKQYRSLHAECEHLRKRIADKRGGIYDLRSVAASCTNVRSGEIADRVERVVEMMDEAMDHYTRRLTKAEESEKRITELIDSISDSEERSVLFLHYIEGKTFFEISEILYLSERSIWYRHKSAISRLCDEE